VEGGCTSRQLSQAIVLRAPFLPWDRWISIIASGIHGWAFLLFQTAKPAPILVLQGIPLDAARELLPQSFDGSSALQSQMQPPKPEDGILIADPLKRALMSGPTRPGWEVWTLPSIAGDRPIAALPMPKTNEQPGKHIQAGGGCQFRGHRWSLPSAHSLTRPDWRGGLGTSEKRVGGSL